MKLLIIGSGNAPIGQKFDLALHQAFIYEQALELKKFGVDTHFFLIKGKGLWGYFMHYFFLKKELSKSYELLHAHNGLCGLLANLQRKVPVVTTFHGSDINVKKLRLISYIPLLLSTQNIFVSDNQVRKIAFKRKINTIPCGVDLSLFMEKDRIDSKKNLKLSASKKYILFSSSFSNDVKNYPLAHSALLMINNTDVELLELKNKSRTDVAGLINSCEMVLLTSFSEGSPQIIKEAMACNCPIVSTDVGDVREIIGNTDGCYITSYDPADIAKNIKLALDFSKRIGHTNGRERIVELGLDAGNIAKRISEVYKKALES